MKKTSLPKDVSPTKYSLPRGVFACAAFALKLFSKVTKKQPKITPDWVRLIKEVPPSHIYDREKADAMWGDKAHLQVSPSEKGIEKDH